VIVTVNSDRPEDEKLSNELRKHVRDEGPSLAALIAREEHRLGVKLGRVDPDTLPVPLPVDDDLGPEGSD
jgi:hypothetical protein